MKKTITFSAAILLSLACATAHAQFGFRIPGITDKLEKSGINLDSLVNHAVKATAETPENEEIRIGEEFAATLVGAKPLVDNPALQRYVNTLGRWLALQTERPDLPWTFGVLDDADFNAFATPGGYVFVTRGLVERMRSEAELAGVLAHEIAHVLKKHHLRAVQKGAKTDAIVELGSALVKGGNQEAREFAVNLGRKLYITGLDKSDEFEADRLGVVIAARAGFDPFGLPAVLQVLQRQNAADSKFSLLFKTHPAPADRLGQLDQLMHTRFEGMAGNAGKPLQERLKEYAK